jgi:porphobilinogen synthase
MTGMYRYSVDRVTEELDEIVALGIPSVLLFGLTDEKDAHASWSTNPEGAVQRAIRLIKSKYPDLVVFTDVCVCAYTHHGHCGILTEEGEIENDLSLELLQKMALSHAEAGADFVAPSAMMDGQVGAIREVLDAHNFSNVGIMGYSAKYYSECYGPFRDAANSAPKSGNRSSYQMEPGNRKEAIIEIESDIAEGADIIMVKPALFYLDIISDANQLTNIPVAAYNVSGEYAMVKAAAEKGWIDGEKVMMEMLLSIKRAGAKIIISYFAKEVARVLKNTK